MLELEHTPTVLMVMKLIEGQCDSLGHYRFNERIRLYDPCEHENGTNFIPGTKEPWLDMGWDAIIISEKEHSHIKNLFLNWRYTEGE